MRSISFARLDLDLLDERRLLHRAIELDIPSWRVAERRLFRADQWDRELCNRAVQLALDLGSNVETRQEVVAFWVDRFKQAGACTQSEYGFDKQQCRRVSHYLRTAIESIFDGCFVSLETRLLECTEKLEKGKWPRLAKNKGHDIFESGELSDLVRLLPYYPRLSLIDRDALCRIPHTTLDDFFKSFAEMLSTEGVQDEDAAQYETKTVDISDLGLDADADAEDSNKGYYIAARLWRDLNVKLVGVPEQMYEVWYFDPVSRTHDRNRFDLTDTQGVAMKMNALSVLAREWMVSLCQRISILGPADVQAIDTFADAISSGSLPNLDALYLQRTNIGDDGMKAFASAIASGSLPNLQELFLGNNQIGGAGMSALAGAIANGSLPNLWRLNLANNKIGDVGMTELSSAIASGSLRNLQKLFLRNNQIGDAGMSALAAAIATRSLPNLLELNLNINNIGDAGMRAFAGAVARGSLRNLLSLDLSRTDIGDEGMKAFAASLYPTNESLLMLKTLRISLNRLGEDGMSVLADAIQRGRLPSLSDILLFRGVKHTALDNACRARRIRIFR